MWTSVIVLGVHFLRQQMQFHCVLTVETTSNDHEEVYDKSLPKKQLFLSVLNSSLFN